MESLSSILPRTLAAIQRERRAGFADLAPRKPATIRDLANEFDRLESFENPDVIVNVNALRMTEAGTVDVPRMGTFAFTDWSREQTARLLGVKFDRWFENTSPVEQADEMNRRFTRAGGSVRLRTVRAMNGSGKDGTLRAIVSPGYAPVSDARLARLLTDVLAPLDEELAVVRCDLTDRTASYVVKVGEAYRPGGDGVVGDLWGGILVRNSNVGFASLVVSLHLTRLLCLNGMTAPLPNATLVRARHRGLSDDKIRSAIADGLADVPGKLRQSADALRRSRERVVVDVEAEVTKFLRGSDLPLRLAPAIVEAYQLEPDATAFGVAQAVTRAAQGKRAETRVELEHAAARYVAA